MKSRPFLIGAIAVTVANLPQPGHGQEYDAETKALDPTKKFKIPLGVRFGRVLVEEKGSWNYYFEYQTSAVYDDWPGSAVRNSYRLNVTYTIPPF